MKLADFLFETGMTPSQLRKTLGLKHRSTISRYLTGERIPEPYIMQRIIEITGGRVQLRDFLSPGNPKCATVIILPNGKKRLVFPWSTRKTDLKAASDVEKVRVFVQDDQSEAQRRAVQVLYGRVKKRPDSTWLLDGRPADQRRLITEANKKLLAQGQPLIPYPGLAEAA